MTTSPPPERYHRLQLTVTAKLPTAPRQPPLLLNLLNSDRSLVTLELCHRSSGDAITGSPPAPLWAPAPIHHYAAAPNHQRQVGISNRDTQQGL